LVINRGFKGRSPFKTYSSPSLTREGDKGGRLLRKYKGDRVTNKNLEQVPRKIEDFSGCLKGVRLTSWEI